MSDTVNLDAWTPGRFAHGLYEYTLKSNGLKAYLYPMNNGKGVSAVNVTYNVGSANEGVGETGYTHLLEHANFKHSGIWAHQAKGAVINAMTQNDITNYYAILPSTDMPAYLSCEAGRMQQTHFTESDIASEMPVVHNEMELGDNSAFGALYKATVATSMSSHTYHHSTIGYSEDVRAVTAAKLHSFFQRYYTPSNAAVTVTGDFDPRVALDKIASGFGDIESHAVPPRNLFEIEQQGPKSVMIQQTTPASMVQLAFHAPAASSTDSIVLELIGKMIKNGYAGRAQPFISGGQFHDVTVMAHRMRDTYPFMIVGQIPSLDPQAQGWMACLKSLTPSRGPPSRMRNYKRPSWP